MPMYDFKCEDCGKIKAELIPTYIEVEDACIRCPACDGDSFRIFTLGKGVSAGEGRTMWSKAMGINPEQIQQMNKRYPHHKYHPITGDLQVNGPVHQKKLAKELGMAIH